VPQESVIGPLLYLIYTADGPTKDDSLIATFTDDTAKLSSDADPARASERLYHLSLLQKWLKQSAQITFSTRRDLCPQVNINNISIPIKTEVKYLGLHLNQKLAWKTHIKAKRRQLELELKHLYWLMNKISKLRLKTN
jgi:hypothetical protein